ncbi:UPF0481 protein At3g47200-like [Hibiscus syriacus]|uniref:UPF0481 protein At3g47200-like n=1 Tax=Hibiscus syriacus TaxID=106335 RepID=UPI001921B3A1|nr:UPF0481 protein At3g47200-like [Hibiscus syriacus]
MSSNCCVFKTPIILNGHNRQAYVPDAFSIGPRHYGQIHSKGTQKLKLKYLEGLIHHSPNPVTRLVELEEAMTEIKLETHECYGGPVIFSGEEFVKILVLDGCLIIELFWKDVDEVERDEDDPIFIMSCMLHLLYLALILQENQVPWLVLDSFFNLTRAANETKSLSRLAIEFFGNMFSSDAPSMDRNLFFGKDLSE